MTTEMWAAATSGLATMFVFSAGQSWSKEKYTASIILWVVGILTLCLAMALMLDVGYWIARDQM